VSQRSETASLELRGVDVELGGRTVLAHIDAVIAPGSPVGVAGASGSGKSVLCLVASGALTPTRGEVRYDGRPFPGDGSVARGIVLQSHGLVGGLTAAENVSLPMQVRGVPRAEVLTRAGAALASVGLGEHAGRSVDELSGGERQRVGIARALAGDPAVLVADEPTAELDADNRSRVLALLVRHAERGNVVLVASDDPEVLDVCGALLDLERGRLVAPV
jgi:putative ABC transport system ATP-binding protein